VIAAALGGSLERLTLLWRAAEEAVVTALRYLGEMPPAPPATAQAGVPPQQEQIPAYAQDWAAFFGIFANFATDLDALWTEGRERRARAERIAEQARVRDLKKISGAASEGGLVGAETLDQLARLQEHKAAAAAAAAGCGGDADEKAGPAGEDEWAAESH
jgi:hypothetical protein